jgi:IclR family transcriptional regulator, acetate operon repressor
MTSVPGTQAVDRAAQLLVAILSADEPLTFSDLQRDSGLAKSTVSRLLSSLERNALVMRDDEGQLLPGAALTRFAQSRRPHDQLIALATPHLDALSAATGETVNLAVIVGHEVEQIAQVDSTFLMGNVDWVGMRVPLHCTALGKVFLAAGAPLPDGRLERLTPRTISTRVRLERELDVVRERGWAVADSELEPGLVAVAAPVRGGDGSVVAALSVTGPSARIGRERFAELGLLLTREAGTLSAQLGHSPDTHRKAGAA